MLERIETSDFAISAGPQHMKLETNAACRLLCVSQLARGWWEVRIQKEADRCCLRH